MRLLGGILTALVIGIAGLTLAGCGGGDGYYEDYDGHHKHWKQRALEPKGHFSSDDFPASSIGQ